MCILEVRQLTVKNYLIVTMDCVCIGLVLILSISSGTATSPLILTPFIKHNNTAEARAQSLVNPAIFLNVTSHSGFFTVDERYNSNTFFWYFPVAGKPVNATPWVVWLQGGPGASSLAGLFDEIGPFEYDKGQLKLRQWSWTKEYSMLFIDNPIGAGYSFTDSDAGLPTNMETYSKHLYTALHQFLSIFPELRPAPLFIAGESYAGRYLPALATKIHAGKQHGNLPINLQGLMMGNPVLNRENIVNLTSVFFNWGLIDSQGAQAASSLQEQYTRATRDGDYKSAYDLRNKLFDKLQGIAMQQQTFNLLADGYSFRGFEEYIGRQNVRAAMHVGDVAFTFSNAKVHETLVPDFLSEVQPKIEALLENYRILIYCGQLDLTAPCVPNAEGRRKRWHWSRRRDFLKAARVPWWYNETVAGYVKSGGGFTEVLVRGAGHLVPIERPAQAYQLISFFIRGLDLPLPPNYSPEPENTPEYVEVPSARVESSGLTAGLIVSGVGNVILLLVLAVGVVFYVKWKRRNEALFYSTVDNVSDDLFLT